MEGMGKRDLASGIGAYMAIGDSFTEGLHDPGPDGGYLGWADRVAGALSAQRPGFRYANLAIRGKLLREVVAEQLPRVGTTSCTGPTWTLSPRSSSRSWPSCRRRAAGCSSSPASIRACSR